MTTPVPAEPPESSVAVSPDATAPDDATPWAASGEAVAAALGTDAERGLSCAEAEERLTAVGPNELEVQRAGPWWRLLGHQFVTPLILVLYAADEAFSLRVLGPRSR